MFATKLWTLRFKLKNIITGLNDAPGFCRHISHECSEQNKTKLWCLCNLSHRYQVWLPGQCCFVINKWSSILLVRNINGSGVVWTLVTVIVIITIHIVVVFGNFIHFLIVGFHSFFSDEVDFESNFEAFNMEDHVKF